MEALKRIASDASSPNVAPLTSDHGHDHYQPDGEGRGRGQKAHMNHSGSDTDSTMSVSDEDVGATEKEIDLEDQAQPADQSNSTLEFSNAGEKKDPNLVEFDGPNDPDNPKNWSVRRRTAITISTGFMTFVVTFSSSIYASAITPIMEEFHIDEVTSTLGVSLFLLGFVFGPVVFGPASEVFGRRVPLMIGYAIFAILNIPVAVAQNVQTIMLGRFFSGFAAAAPLAIVAGLLADIWDPIGRAYAICVYAYGGFAGPVFGPIIGGFLVDSYLGWRWTAWITLIMAALFGCIGFVIIPETSAPRILQLRAKRLRHETKNWALHAKADEQKIDAYTMMTVYLVRPFIMLAKEPILAVLTAYLSFIYGILYLFFEAFPVSFQLERGWNPGVGSLPFLSFIIGMALGVGSIAYSTATNFKRSYLKHGQVIPEQRLPPMIAGALILPVGLFWFGWTSDPHITWVPQVLACGVLGGSLMTAFWQGINYIIDCYGSVYSNSAVSANSFVRSIVGAVFPLFASTMYRRLGVAWASSLLGFLCVAFAPVPILFYYYGARIRAKSKFAPT